MGMKAAGTTARVAGVVTAVAAGLLMAAPSAGAAESVQRETGQAFSCQGTSGDMRVGVELYQNNVYGSHASVFVETPDGEFGGGWGPGSAPIVDGRKLSASIPFKRLGEGPGPVVGTAEVSGRFHNAGPRTAVHEVIEDAGEIITTDGWNRRLGARVTVDVMGRSVKLTCSDAFAFDLTVTRTPAV